MKNWFLIPMSIAVFFAFYLPKDSPYQLYGKTAAIIFVMIGVMKLMQKIPSKNQNEEEDV
ncbi:MAG: hypothetical protein J0M25_10105 [Flavobacteriales bacterium]|jgi:hypothetical protein|uniref:hypothetical protein n=1 Tax=Flavobacterium sp. TaxID=239 RepID=UPI001AD14252|nr:hypothetical protein [Flavobacteriales bacterium]